MSKPRVYVDFLKTDDDGRLLLTCRGTLHDLAAQEVHLRDGLTLYVYSDDLDDHGNEDNLIAEGIVRFDAANDRWVLEVDEARIRHESDD